MNYKELWAEFYKEHYNEDAEIRTTQEEGNVIAFGRFCVKKYKETKPKYNNEDLETDVDWLEGQGLDRQEAEKFIRSLLDKESGLNEQKNK